jgi:hypothetical protein
MWNPARIGHSRTDGPGHPWICRLPLFGQILHFLRIARRQWVGCIPCARVAVVQNPLNTLGESANASSASTAHTAIAAFTPITGPVAAHTRAAHTSDAAASGGPSAIRPEFQAAQPATTAVHRSGRVAASRADRIDTGARVAGIARLSDIFPGSTGTGTVIGEIYRVRLYWMCIGSRL